MQSPAAGARGGRRGAGPGPARGSAPRPRRQRAAWARIRIPASELLDAQLFRGAAGGARAVHRARGGTAHHFCSSGPIVGLQIFSLALSQPSYRGFDIVAGGQQLAALRYAQKNELLALSRPAMLAAARRPARPSSAHRRRLFPYGLAARTSWPRQPRFGSWRGHCSIGTRRATRRIIVEMQ